MTSHVNRVMWIALPALLVSAAVTPVMACSCIGESSPCWEIGVGNAAFTGKVLSVSPAFLNRYSRSSRSDVGRIIEFYGQLKSGTVGLNLPALKETFRSLVANPDEKITRRLSDANSPQKLLKLFDDVIDGGSRVTFEVKTVFAVGGDDDAGKNNDKNDKVKNADVKDDAKPSKAKLGKAKADDDDDKKKDDGDALAEGKSFTVWTPFGDCGIDFQIGETYLVYTSMDEDTNLVETDICMGTRRFADAGADLPYLYFHKNDPKASAHLGGFVTSDPAVYSAPFETDNIASPVAGILIELKSDSTVRYTTSGPDGRFVFEGLSNDTYTLSGYSTEYPDPRYVVAGPSTMKLSTEQCNVALLLARPASAKH